jgi:wyosine [tRNA(Phe)-imidazoG37] synthetase (radical SAM superfamily)
MPEYTYGPVPSRRLGRSLGVDLVPPKTCDLNCIYCQLGRTEHTTLLRAEYAPVDAVVAEVRRRLAGGPRPDYVTLAGSGEPTLHLRFGDVAAGIKAASDVPIALVTNGTLFHLPEVRAACDAIDLILPNLDAGDEETFRRINRPHGELTLETVVDGLAHLRQEFAGQIWLEVFLVEGVNTTDEQVAAIARCVDRIDPHRVQINTAVRPPAEADVRVPSAERLEEVRAMLGPRAEVVVPLRGLPETPGARAERGQVLATLRRRPCTLEDVARGLGIHPAEAAKHLGRLLDEGAIQVRQRLYETYYEAVHHDDTTSTT